MKSIRLLLISAVFIVVLSLSTSLSIGEDYAIPFNDLLPPLLETEINNATATTTTAKTKTTTTTTTTTKKPTIKTTVSVKTKPITTHVPPSLFKSTKKSYYQKQTEHIKELHLIDDDMLVPHDYKEQAEHLQHLQGAPENEYQQQQSTAQQQSSSKPLKQEQQKKLEKIQSLRPLTSQTTLAPRITQQQRVGNQQKINSSTQKAAKPFVKNVAAQQKPKTNSFQANKPLIGQQQQVQELQQQVPATTHGNLQVKNVGLTIPKNQKFSSPTVRQIQKSQNLQQYSTLNQQKLQQQKQQQRQQSNSFKFQQSSQHRFNLQQQQQHQQQRYQIEPQLLNLDAFQQYIDFQHTTHRPPKAGLPTLTPFPRHLK